MDELSKSTLKSGGFAKSDRADRLVMSLQTVEEVVNETNQKLSSVRWPLISDTISHVRYRTILPGEGIRGRKSCVSSHLEP